MITHVLELKSFLKIGTYMEADKLVAQGRHTHELSLYFRGMDLPRWLTTMFHQAGYII